MLIIDSTAYDQASIGDNIGAPEYSYWFVYRRFKPILESLGERLPVRDPEAEVDPAYRAALGRGEDCAYLSFHPPQCTAVDLECPTVPVFAWEFDQIPNESWNENPLEDWTVVLAKTQMAITHCASSAASVRAEMGEDYPVWVIPAPVFDAHKKYASSAAGWRPPVDLDLTGGIAINAGDVDLSLFRPELSKAERTRPLLVLERAMEDANLTAPSVRAEGVIYTTVFNPYDGRKNWRALLSAFVWAFRDEPSATLVAKIARFDLEDGLGRVLSHLSVLGRFKCRVLVVNGMLSDEAYSGLVEATSFALSASHGEGQCLPLMEFMSAGRPVVAPGHTAMADYVTPQNGFIVECETKLTPWPHDERVAQRCRHYVPSFLDLVRQLRNSFRVARDDAEAYEAMSAQAQTSLQKFCSDDVVKERLEDVFRHVRRREGERGCVG